MLSTWCHLEASSCICLITVWMLADFYQVTREEEKTMRLLWKGFLLLVLDGCRNISGFGVIYSCFPISHSLYSVDLVPAPPNVKNLRKFRLPFGALLTTLCVMKGEPIDMATWQRCWILNDGEMTEIIHQYKHDKRSLITDWDHLKMSILKSHWMVLLTCNHIKGHITRL